MADRFYSYVELPDIPTGTVVPTADAGFIKLYGKDGKLYYKFGANAEVSLKETVVTKLIIDGGDANTLPESFVLRFDFGGAV